MTDPVERERFALLLPFYINGTLAEGDRLFVEGWLANHAEARLELAFSQRIRSEIRQLESRRPADAGLDSPLAACRTERSATSMPAPWFRRRLPIPQPALVLAGLVLTLQTLSIVALLPRTEAPASGRSVPGEATPVVLEVAFAAQAHQSEVLALLRQAGGEIIGGPTADGRFRVAFAAASDEALARLRANPLVAAAQASGPGH